MSIDHRRLNMLRRIRMSSCLGMPHILALLIVAAMASLAAAQQANPRPQAERNRDPSGFPWPGGAKMALSLTFDDGRSSQVTHAVPLLDSMNVKATFYAQPENLLEELALWQQAAVAGHEFGNHTIGHPCTGNFAWVRYDGVVLESYDLDRMRAEIVQANDEIEKLLGVRPVSFAYPCGQTYVGRGRDTQSYVPLVAELFQTGRRWLDETSNAPDHFDTAQVMAMRMDGEDFSRVRRMIEGTKRNENWLVLAGHSVSDSETSRWGTKLGMLRELLAYAQDPDNGVWLAPVAEVASFIAQEKAARE
ncbi:MAG: polysaccharide deacetylase family protein [Candidatus Latescibacteria bacterium]|nr:polysaccharide deacetylase family protein [Candidatus Latescibacterota bacterium]